MVKIILCTVAPFVVPCHMCEGGRYLFVIFLKYAHNPLTVCSKSYRTFGMFCASVGNQCGFMISGPLVHKVLQI